MIGVVFGVRPRSSLATEMIKGKKIDDCLSVKNTDIASYLKLPPVKLHCRSNNCVNTVLAVACGSCAGGGFLGLCSMLAEDAIKAAVTDYKTKQAKATE